MSLLVTSLLLGAGVLIGRWFARAGKDPAAAALPEAEARRSSLRAAAVSDAAGERPSPRVVDWSVFPCALGDVIVRAGGEEAWLAGALVLSEDRPAAAVFVAPEAGGDHAILVRPRPSEEIVWLESLPPDEVILGAEPPTSIEVRGTRYERLRRLPLRVDRVGTGAPDVGEAVIFAEYAAAPPERLLVILGGGAARVWRGTLLEPGMYDVLAAGHSTLDP